MSIVAIVQARMESTRLPCKSVMRFRGKPMLWHVLNRVWQAKCIDEIILIIPNEQGKRCLVTIAEDLYIPVRIWDGNPNDLIGRYADAARQYNADVIVRAPGDKPCVDPNEIDRIISLQQQQNWHWLTSNLDQNIHCNGYPGGLGAEVYPRRFLEWLDKYVEHGLLREHPHLWAFANDKVLTCSCPTEFTSPELRFDVNTLEDFQYIESLYLRLSEDFRSRKLVNLAKESALDIAV